MTQPLTPHWPDIVFSQKWLDQLDHLSNQRFRLDGLGEEAATYVIDKLSENDWQRLHIYTGNSAPQTFIYSITINLLEEFSRKKFGRLRPPVWIKNEGGIWLKTWKMICLERQPIPVVIDSLCTNEQRQPDFVNAVIKTIKAKLPWCGIKYRHVSSDSEEAITEPQAPSIENDLFRQNVDEKLTLISELLENLNGPSNSSGDKSDLKGKLILDILSNQLNVTEEELLVLKMAFEDGLKLKVLARALGMPAYQPGRILKRVFKQIASALQHMGVRYDDVLSMLEELES